MKQIICVFLGVFTLPLAGCNDDEALIKEQQNKIEVQESVSRQLEGKIVELEKTIKGQQKVIDNHKKEFSYLNDLTKSELEAYKLFAEEKETEHLSGFSPEKIVLIYYHSVVIDDVEAIYSLTYDDGALPDYPTFKQKYYKEGLSRKDLESTLDFRYYNSIKVREENKTDTNVTVEMGVNYGRFHHTIIEGLKKEEGIWKIDILHLLKYFEEKRK